MAFLDWIKGPEHAYQANHGIKTIWKGAAHADKASGYSVQACLGMSEKGYHAGLAFTPKEGEAKTTWHRPLQRRDHAMQECYSSFNKWVENHEAQVNDKPQPKGDAKKVRRPAPSWDR
jgi:hypothetical protein